jgi:hypothetical protein
VPKLAGENGARNCRRTADRDGRDARDQPTANGTPWCPWITLSQ